MKTNHRAIRFIGASGLVLAVSITAQGYDAGSVKWPRMPVSYYINPRNLDVPEADAIAAVQQGADAWGQQSGANFRYAYAGTTSISTNSNDGKNVVMFRNASNGGTIATAYTWWSGGSIIDADVVFWDAGFQFHTGTSGCSGGMYIEDVATHELGHALGLGHSAVGSATMYPSIGWCAQTGRQLDPDDIAGVEALYPPSGSSPSPSPSPSASPSPAPSPSPSPLPPSGIALSARAYKTKSAKSVELGWSGASGATVDIYRNGVLHLSTPNDGTHTDTSFPKKGGGSFSYRLCESGSTSVCSATVSVAF